MADLLKSQTEWNNFFKILGAEIIVSKTIRSWWARAEKLRSGVTIQQDQQPIYVSISLAGQAVIGENTDSAGILYGEYTAAGTLTEIFSDSARTQLVASGVTPASSTVTLTEQNSSGFTGIVVVRSAVVAVNDADWQIEVSQDLKRILTDVYSNVLDIDQDKAETASKSLLQSRVTGGLVSLYTGRRSDFVTNVITTFIANFLQISPTDRNNGAGFRYTYDTVSLSGQRLIANRLGIFAELRQAMLDQSAPAGPQTVLAGTPTSGNLTPLVGNVGSLKQEGVAASTAITLALSQQVQTGTLRLRCTSATIGQARFSVENVLAEKLIASSIIQTRNDAVLGEGQAQIDRRYQDESLGVDFTLRHLDPVESTDTGNIFSGVDYENMNSRETDFGKIYGKVVRTKTNPPDATDEFELTFYANSARDILIGTQTILGIVGTTPISVLTNGGMTITGTFDNVNAHAQLPVIDDEIATVEWDSNPPKLGDQWTVTLTGDLASGFNEYMAQNHLGSLPTAGSPTISDDYVKFTPTLEG